MSNTPTKSTSHHHTYVWVLRLAVCVASAASSAQAQFQPIGFLPSVTSSYASAISADGTTVVGGSSFAFRWRQSTGIQPLAGLPAVSSGARAVSADGSVVTVGRLNANPWRWVDNGAGGGSYITLPGFSGISSWDSAAISHQGNVIVGTTQGGHQGVRWSSGSSQLLPQLDFAHGVTPNGSTVLGIDDSLLVGQPAYLVGSTRTILPLPGTPWPTGFATHGTDDLSVIIGSAYNANGAFFHHTLVRWDNGIVTNLGDLPGGSTYAIPHGMSADGSVIVGRGSVGANFTAMRGFVWTSETGMVQASAYFESFGLSFPGWTITRVSGVSADGLAFCGIGTNPQGQQEAWFARVPAPGSAAILALFASVTFRRQRVAKNSSSGTSADQYQCTHST